MDVSKLPRLSKTDSPQTPPDASTTESSDPAAEPVPSRFDPVGIGTEVWFAIIIGLIFMAIGNAFAQYEIGKLTHHPYHTKVTWQEGPNEGAEVLYPDLMGEQYYSDSGLFFFGLSLMVVAFAQVLSMTRLPIRALIEWGALLIVILATGYNIFVSAKLFGIGVIPVLSLLCVALGGYEVFLQYRVVGPAAKRGG